MSSSRLAFAEGPRNERLFHLLRRVREGDILIPRFQRPFVWTDEKRILLLDSIRRRMPIGALIVWRTMTQELQCFEQIAGVKINADAARRQGEIKTYVLDGHQRLTTLYAALADGLATEEGNPPVDLAGLPDEEQPGDERPVQLLYDLEKETFLISPTNGEPPAAAVPLSILFDRYRLREFEHKQLFGLRGGRRLIVRLGDLVDAFKDYELPILTLATEDESLATDAFIRINSAGAPLDQVGMVSAAVWNDDVDLKAEIDAVLSRLADDGWQDLEPKWVLSALKARLNLDLYTNEINVIRANLKNHPTAFDDTSENLQRASRLLASAGIHGPRTLPYIYQLILLADALGQVPADPTPALQERLRHWFWSTTYTETFASINSTRLRAEQAHIRAIAGGQTPPRRVDAPVIPIKRFDFRSARGRAMIVTMAEISPCGPDGRRMDALRLLAEHGNNVVPTLFNSTSISSQQDNVLETILHASTGSGITASQFRAPENRIICPPAQANELRRMLTTGLEQCPPGIRLSHEIDDDAVEAWLRGGPSAMLRARRARLLAVERSLVERLGLRYAPDPAE